MATPQGWVKVTVEEVRDIPDEAFWVPEAYLLVWIGTRRLGRSRSVAGDSVIDFRASPEAWTVEVPVGANDPIPVRVALYDAQETKPIVRVKGTIDAPWTPGQVQVTQSPTLVVNVVESVQVGAPAAEARVRRSGSSEEVSATLRAGRMAALEFTEIGGLNKPAENPGADPTVPAWRARPVVGYTSEDHHGRIYINRDLDGAWKKDTQLIELTVRVHVFGKALSPDTKVRWTLLDPDDPSNDDPDVHREWGRYYDPLDYDSSGDLVGPKGGDNARMFDEAGTGTPEKIFDTLPAWEQVAGFAMEGSTIAEVKTAIGASELGSSVTESRVRLHCPNVGGATIMVRAELDPAPAFPVIPAQTGIMTMWKRINVELARMHEAPMLWPIIGDVATCFEPACVQLDFHPEIELKDNNWQSPEPMAYGEKAFDRYNKAGKWVKRVFSHRKDPGWFFLGSAKRPYDASGAAGKTVFNSGVPGSTWTIGRWDWKRPKPKEGRFEGEHVEINSVVKLSDRRQIESAYFSWQLKAKGVTMDVEDLYFPVMKASRHGQATRIALSAHDITSRFTGHDSDGSIDHAYESKLWFYPRGVFETRVGGTWLAHAKGYDIPANAECKIRTASGSTLVGISPPRSIGKDWYFAGQTIVFSYFEPESASTEFYEDAMRFVVHELAHAFGMPHKCGFWDDRANRQESCVMNYFNHWLLEKDSINRLDPVTEGKQGTRMCGRHAMEIRRVHLEDNKGLAWGS